MADCQQPQEAGSVVEFQQVLHHPQHGEEELQVQGHPLLLTQQHLLQLEHQATEQRNAEPPNTGFLGHSEVTGKKHFWYF